MAHVDLGVALLAGALLAGCWEDRGSCELWVGKLERGEEAAVAVHQLADNRCVGARALLLSRMGDANLGTDVLAALIGLGQSPEAEAAVRAALGKGETAAAAAAQVVTWKLASAEPELRAALADQALAMHHPTLLDAALAIAPAGRWVGTLTRELGDAGPTMERALAALATVDWSGVPEPERADAALALADLASRDGVDPARARAALHELGRLPPALPADVSILLGRVDQGNRAALLALWCLGHPAASERARGLATREGLPPGARSLALALASRDGDLAAPIASAPAEDELAIGLALAGGSAAVPPLEARFEADKGAARAAFARALGLALPTDRLAAWEEDLRKSPSLLLRGIPDEPAIARVLALGRRCGTDSACLGAAIDDALPGLGALDSELSAARAALEAARQKAEAAVAADAARASELAKVTSDLPAARQELEAIAARRDVTYAGVGEASKKVAELAATPLALAWSLRRLPAEAAIAPAREILASCHGEACLALRGWAAVAAGDPALACRLELPEPP